MECQDCIDLLLKFLTFLATVSGLVVVGYEYYKGQKWKRAEFLAKEMKTFSNDSEVKNAHLMLDWSSIDITLTKKAKKDIFFTDDLLFSALAYHLKDDGTKNNFSDEETEIRLIFDSYFEKLSVFESYIRNKLISKEDLHPYINYYFKIIGDPNNNRKEEKYRKQIWNFILKYEYEQIISLLKMYGYSIKT